MSTDKKIMSRGILYLTFALPLLFLGPSIIHSSFKNQHHPYYWLVLSIGVMVSLAAMYLTFFGIKTMVKSIFDSTNK